jgi:Holliday junction resolvase RusA-like endonuclease
MPRALTKPCVAERPFALLNHIWAYNRKGVRPSALYVRWKATADGMAREQKLFRGLRCIEGPFMAELLIEQSRRIDVDNAMKAPLDWAQSRMIVANDGNCRKSTVERVVKSRAPTGARLIITELA